MAERNKSHVIRNEIIITEGKVARATSSSVRKMSVASFVSGLV